MPTINVNGHSINVNTNIEIRPGYSPYIGPNGHWMVYDTSVKTFIDTGVVASKDASFATPFDNTKDYQAGEYVFYSNKLYRFVVDHLAGSWNATQVVEAALVDNMEDLERFSTDLNATMADVSYIEDMIGDSPMGTDEDTLTGAISEHQSKIGNTTMGTTASTLTGAVKEVVDKIGNTTTGTTATTLTGSIKEVVDNIGDTDMGTTATTVTGAVAELKTDMGDLKCVNIALPQVSGESVLSLVQRAFAHADMPKGVPFIAQVVSGLYYTLYGYWYPAGDYGYCIVSQYWNAYKVNLNNGSWSIRGITRVEDVASGYLTTAKALTTSYSIIPIGDNLVLRGNFEKVSDGGYRTLNGGSFKISAYAYINSLNVDDNVGFVISRYNGGWLSDTPTVLTPAGRTDRTMTFPTIVTSANANDIIYLRGRNMTAARGSVISARILIELTY